MIQCTGITKRFPKAPIETLKDITFRTNPGEITCILGSNGVGKTTLLRILATLIIPTSGKALVGSYCIQKEPRQVRSSIGLCINSSERSFYFRLSGFQNLAFFGALMGLEGQKLKHRVSAVLERVGLLDEKDKLFMNYSAGMKKRLSIARALLGDPPVYLLDEPTGGLDLSSRAMLCGLINELKMAGKTILLTTHESNFAQTTGDKILFLKRGKILIEGSPSDVRRLLSSQCISVCFQGYIPQSFMAFVERLPGVAKTRKDGSKLSIFPSSDVDIQALAKLILERQIAFQELYIGQPGLEDVYDLLSNMGGP